jgi:hypothetical protein
MLILLNLDGRGATHRLYCWFWLIDTLKIADLLESFNESVIILLNRALYPLFHLISAQYLSSIKVIIIFSLNSVPISSNLINLLADVHDTQVSGPFNESRSFKLTHSLLRLLHLLDPLIPRISLHYRLICHTRGQTVSETHIRSQSFVVLNSDLRLG